MRRSTIKDPVERFWSHIGRVDGCWEWEGYHDRFGYGKCTSPLTGKTAQVHVVVYTLTYGPVPPGMVLDHEVCDNPSCCNPGHVSPKSQRENVLRGKSPMAINARKTHCPAGHPLQPGNLMARPKGRRSCLTCHRERERARPKPQRMYRHRPPGGWPESVVDEVRRRAAAGERQSIIADSMRLPRQTVNNWLKTSA
jgi:HNH endonuclease